MSLRDTHRDIAKRYPRILGKLAEGPDAPQQLYCESCDEPATADDWLPGLGVLLCPTCLENLMDAPKETL